jgi:hypothetical protein
MDYCIFWSLIYDLRWETMNVYTIHEIIFENSTELSVKSADNSVNSAKFRVSKFLLFLAWLNFVLAKKIRFSPNFSELLKIVTPMNGYNQSIRSPLTNCCKILI